MIWDSPIFRGGSAKILVEILVEFSRANTCFGYGIPKTMQSIVEIWLPKFKKFESDSLKGSFDFLGMNCYSADYVEAQSSDNVNHSYDADIQANFTSMLILYLNLMNFYIHHKIYVDFHFSNIIYCTSQRRKMVLQFVNRCKI